MSSVNKVILIGRVGKDPETRYTSSGDAITNLTLATSESWKDKNGEKQEKTEWHRITFYRKLAEIVGEYVKKGSQIYVEGKLETRKWTNKEGVDQYSTGIVASEMKMLSSKTSEGGQSSNQSKKQDSDQGGFDDSDEIPF